MSRLSEEKLFDKRNLSRYFVENRSIAWVAFAVVMLWGIWAYTAMPKRKDPDIPPRQVAVVTPWAGQTSEQVEQLVTRKIEERLALNQNVVQIKSVTRPGLSVVYAELDERRTDISKDLDDLKIKLDGIASLPEGAGPIDYVKDFGDTSALMLTVASPQVDESTTAAMASRLKPLLSASDQSIAICAPDVPESYRREAATLLESELGSALSFGDATANADCTVIPVMESPADLQVRLDRAWSELPQKSDLHPDIWSPLVLKSGMNLAQVLHEHAGPKYTYRELDDFTDRLEKEIKTASEVSRITRVGLLREQVELHYSQDRLAQLGLAPAALPALLAARNSTVPAGDLVSGTRSITYQPTNQYSSISEIADTSVGRSQDGTPFYVRDIGQVRRGYEHPAQLTNRLSVREASGNWTSARAITLSIEMKKGEQIDAFAKAVWRRVDQTKGEIPGDLTFERSADQQRQVDEKISLFMRSLWEAIVLVVAVSFLCFWEWRSALLMALSIPTTIAITFGLMHLVGLDIQQMSIASLIIALGLLVDDPVVAGDAIKRELTDGKPRSLAAWFGPTKLSKAILYATITNIAAYLPFLLLNGDVGRYVYSLPVTITCSLIASRIVSMTFIPLFGFYLLRQQTQRNNRNRSNLNFVRWYGDTINFLINHRRATLAVSVMVLLFGAFGASHLSTQFFPRENFYIAYVDIRLPDDAPIAVTQAKSAQAEQVVQAVADRESALHQNGPLIHSITSFVGAGGPRFWFSVTPESPAPNYAQLLIQFTRSEDTNKCVAMLQDALSQNITGARVDVRTVELGPPTIIPISIRITGDDVTELHRQALKLEAVLQTTPRAFNVRDDWGTDVLRGRIVIDEDRAAISGVSGRDIETSMYAGVHGLTIGFLREGHRSLPIVESMDSSERTNNHGLPDLYVYSTEGPQNNVRLSQIASVKYDAEPGTIHRFNQHRAITVSALPAPGYIASQITSPLKQSLDQFEAQLPIGYHMEYAGELHEQLKGQKDSAIVGGVSAAIIFFALILQFNSAIKPMIVFSGIPFGAVGALVTVWIMGLPMGFLAILGVTSLIGVIVSHVIVLFDFIEMREQEGAPLREALVDAGIMRIRPVLITVGATVAALFPLAQHGGPLFATLCWAQIGGLSIATLITLFLVPVVYVVFVEDIKLLRWNPDGKEGADVAAPQLQEQWNETFSG